MRQGMITLSGAPSTTSHLDILHLLISLLGKSSQLLHVDFLPHEELIYLVRILLFYLFFNLFMLTKQFFVTNRCLFCNGSIHCRYRSQATNELTEVEIYSCERVKSLNT